MSGLSNYPDGVTGNEWQIAGPKELTVVRECKGIEARVYPAYLVDEVLRHYPYDSNSLTGTSVEMDYDCTFSGQVDAEIYDYELFWTCPTCGFENVEQWGGPEEFDDRDDDYDDAYFAYNDAD